MKQKSLMGLEGLKKKWVKSTLSDLKRLALPSPDHPYGFSAALLQGSLSSLEWDALCDWLYGQTMMVDEKLGSIVYTYDVIRGLDFIRHGKKTYFD